MLYLIVDPKFFILSEEECEDVQRVNEFLARLVKWAKFNSEYDIEFGITRKCAEELISASYSAFNMEFLAQLASKFSNFDAETIILAIDPLINSLTTFSHLDHAISNLATNTFEYEIENVVLAPNEYLNRLSATLQKSFLSMLGIATFARNQQIVPLGDLENIRILTTYTNGEIQQWARETQYKIFIHLRFTWLLDNTIPQHDELQTLAQFQDEFESIYIAELLPNFAEFRQFSTVLNATQAACKVYPRRLILTPEGEKIASHSQMPNLINVYRALRGLVEVWLPEYERNGSHIANNAFYEHLHFQISSEGEQVNNNPKYRAAREGTYKGGKIYAALHIKLPTGKRIYFEPYNDGEQKIILTRVGQHPPNATS